MIYNIETLIQNIQRNRMLSLGYELPQVFVTTADEQTCAVGTCIYRLYAIGEPAVITEALDLNGAEITGLASAEIPEGEYLDIRLSSVTFAAPSANCSVQMWKRNIAD